MSRVVRYMLIAIGLNVLAGLLLCTPFLFLQTTDASLSWLIIMFMLAAVSLFVQLIVGIVFAAGQNKKELGKGILLSIGIILLVGLSVCSGLAM